MSLDNDKWYGTMTIMTDGRLLGGTYTEKDEQHFHYCLSEDEGTSGVHSRRPTWTR